MHTDDVYELTPQARAELSSAATGLTAAEIALLVRFDGMLTLNQVQASLTASARAGFDAMVQALCRRKLLAPVELDPFSSRFQAEMGQFAALVGGDDETDAALSSLQRRGFFVQIARPRPDARRPAPGEAATVLVVEDEPVLAHFVETYLKLSGFKVRVAGDRAGIVQALREQPLPHLVLMDVWLPDADGFDVLLRMRQHPVLRNVPVVMLTGKATRQAVIKGLTAGADGYLTKPFEPDQVLRAVRTVLGETEAVRGGSANDPWVNGDAKVGRAAR